MAESPAGTVAVWHTRPGRNLPTERVQALVAGVLSGEGISFSHVGVVLSHRDHVHEMNREFLGHDYPTDVLSFVLTHEDEPLEGEVYVDLDMAAERAPEFGVGFQTEAARYVIHGVLHLAGHDDADDEARAEMRRLENAYLSDLWQPDSVDKRRPDA